MCISLSKRVITVLSRYIQAADIDISSQLSLFGPLTKKKVRSIPLGMPNHLIPVVGRYSRRCGIPKITAPVSIVYVLVRP